MVSGLSFCQSILIDIVLKKIPIFISMKKQIFYWLAFGFLLSHCSPSRSNEAKQKKFPVNIIAYYSGGGADLDRYEVTKLSHIIFSFCHLKGNQLKVDDKNDTLTIQKLVALKSKNPRLKVMLSLGGWGGCYACSDIFSTDENRKAFAKSVREVNNYFATDGIDLDWEYPAIPGYPDHPYASTDKDNFTALVKDLRKELGPKNEISFAAGGFGSFIDYSIDWANVMPQVDRVNLMSYDLVSGFSTTSGHHTALYSTSKQTVSGDNGIQLLINKGVPAEKIVIGAAFYSRMWKLEKPESESRYQKGKFIGSVPYKNFETKYSKDSGYVKLWDDEAKAPYAYNKKEGIFASFDDEKSIEAKTKYAMSKKLNGIMFWELSQDKSTDGLVNTMYRVMVNY